MNASDFLVQRLYDWGIRQVYGYPGDGINGLMGAMNRHGDKIRFIQTRHEELAAFMACAHAKWTGEVAVCMATSGPGAIHLLNGLYDAKKDHQPVVAIIGQQKNMSLGADFQQEVDLISLYKDVASQYVHMAAVPEQIRTQIDQAIRIAKAERTVTCVIVPSRHPGDGGGQVAAAQARRHLHRHRLHRTAHHPHGGGPGARRRGAQRRQEGGDAGRRRLPARHRGGDGDRRHPRRRGGQGAPRQGGHRRRPPLLHRRHGAARHPPELRPDDGLRHPADGRLQFPLCRIPAAGREGARRADRHQAAHAQPALSDGGAAARRLQAHPAGPQAAAPAQERPLLAREHREGGRPLVAGDGGAGAQRRQSAQPAVPVLGAVQTPAG